MHTTVFSVIDRKEVGSHEGLIDTDRFDIFIKCGRYFMKVVIFLPYIIVRERRFLD